MVDMVQNVRSLKNERGFLEYVVENCERAFDELQQNNKELLQVMELTNTIDVKRIGDLHRIVQDYLVVRVAGLFDKDPVTSSFAKWFVDNSDYQRISKERIIQYLIEIRHNFVAHNNRGIIDGKYIPDTEQILSSNLRQIFTRLKALLSS